MNDTNMRDKELNPAESSPSEKATLVESAPHASSRRRWLKGAAATAGLAGLVTGGYWIGGVNRRSKSLGRKVIVIGIDGMDPRLCRSMMTTGELPNLASISASGGFSDLGTSVPPQSPVAWANFINGAGPGSHGIYDFIHRKAEHQCEPFFSAAETLPGQGGISWGDYNLQFDFWPFNHQPPKTVLRRQGIPFWDYLDEQKITSVFYDLPSNYPPSPSQYGYHKCVSGMGTPDMLGTYGTYQFFSEDTSDGGMEEGGGKRSKLEFRDDQAEAHLIGPTDSLRKTPKPIRVSLKISRDIQSNSAMIEIQGRKVVLRAGQWSRWQRVDFPISTPTPLPTQHASGIFRIYLQQVAPIFRCYISPINVDPSNPAVPLSEPSRFIQDISKDLGLFYTTGFQEDHKARSNGIFDDQEFLRQANDVLDERMALLEYALHNYEDGLLFFYFSSSDMQSHMFWWNSEENGPHPTRKANEADHHFQYVKQLYKRLDAVIGDIRQRFSEATIVVMSDHGFANFGRQFNLNSWLRDFGYLNPRECSNILVDADWSRTRAYGMGINGLYLNLKGRERDGIVEPGEEQEKLLRQLTARLKAVRDVDGKQVIRNVYRSSEIYTGEATALAPDLIVGYARGYRASWETCLGELTDDVLLDNTSAWSADHCADALEVPGVLFCNRKFQNSQPSLVDLAPSILSLFGIGKPTTMTGDSIF